MAYNKELRELADMAKRATEHANTAYVAAVKHSDEAISIASRVSKHNEKDNANKVIEAAEEARKYAEIVEALSIEVSTQFDMACDIKIVSSNRNDVLTVMVGYVNNTNAFALAAKYAANIALKTAKEFARRYENGTKAGTTG